MSNLSNYFRQKENNQSYKDVIYVTLFIIIKMFSKHFEQIFHNKRKNEVVIYSGKVRAKEECRRVCCHFHLVQNIMIRGEPPGCRKPLGFRFIFHSSQLKLSFLMSIAYGTSWQNILKCMAVNHILKGLFFCKTICLLIKVRTRIK